MSTVSFQSPSLPTISHLPVTVTGAFESLLVDAVVLEFVFAGLLALAGLLAGAFELFTLTLPLHDMQATAKTTTKSRDRVFMKSTPRYFVRDSLDGCKGWTSNTTLVCRFRRRCGFEQQESDRCQLQK
jgi:hypothetical protein